MAAGRGEPEAESKGEAGQFQQSCYRKRQREPRDFAKQGVRQRTHERRARGESVLHGVCANVGGGCRVGGTRGKAQELEKEARIERTDRTEREIER